MIVLIYITSAAILCRIKWKQTSLNTVILTLRQTSMGMGHWILISWTTGDMFLLLSSLVYEFKTVSHEYITIDWLYCDGPPHPELFHEVALGSSQIRADRKHHPMSVSSKYTQALTSGHPISLKASPPDATRCCGHGSHKPQHHMAILPGVHGSWSQKLLESDRLAKAVLV